MLDGESGLLVDDVRGLGPALARVLRDDVLRSRLSKGALGPGPVVHLGRHCPPRLEALAGQMAPLPDR